MFDNIYFNFKFNSIRTIDVRILMSVLKKIYIHEFFFRFLFKFRRPSTTMYVVTLYSCISLCVLK